MPFDFLLHTTVAGLMNVSDWREVGAVQIGVER
jgi:hypothetical protein